MQAKYVVFMITEVFSYVWRLEAIYYSDLLKGNNFT
jgi:hypothetical protein